MKKTLNMLLVGAVLLAGAGMVALTLQTEEVQAAYGYGPMSGIGGCPVYNQITGTATNYDLAVETLDDALEIAQDQIDPDVKEDNIYQMGRWWVVYYTNDDGVVMQSYIDAFTGEVVDSTSQTYNYAPARRGYGYGMMHGYGYGPGMGYGGVYR
ncbi:hypothetical protein J2755_001213 [Methanohalophilus levihalophilus]|uniref:PepSY domain-containing protein n=1 Tax=Methanohalophilus levihalophilus TaxID=1431282 RepID=UPI001AE934F9|nr:PepSY domain-containing protein [Methanohalophilus levihalophilus]MBP2030279.1 hypothetical protein [Methanohalophilus levihalophilus]